MTGELRTAAEVERWLALGLAVRRVVASVGDDDDEGRVARALAACAAELPALPPAGVIADLATLLAGGRALVAAPPAGADHGGALRAALAAYDDDVLARLVATPRFDDVLAAYAHAAAADRPAAAALIAAALCERAGFAGVAVSPAALRRALARWRPGAILPGAGPATGAPVAALAEAYHRLARGARQCRALVDDREVFAVDHLAVLRDLGSRMTATHLAAAAVAIAQRLPRQLPATRQLRGARDTRLADDSTYPAGGFASITPGGATTGNLENLVTSELAYMEDDAPVDVFAMRYLEGELLHYTRDDSVFRRHRHVIGVVLGADLDGARVVDRGLPWQRLILALALVVAATRWLTAQLGDEALTVHLGFPAAALGEERAIVALLLEGEIARGAVALTARPPHEIVALVAAAAGNAIADLVVVSRGERPAIPNGVRALHVELAAAAPVLRDLAARADALATGDAIPPVAWTAWCDSAEDLLRWLM